MNIKPLFAKVVIQEILPETVTKSGIVLPTSAVERPQLAKVVAVGSGTVVDGKVVEMQVKVGDVVLYSQYAGSTFTYEQQEYKILLQNDIMAIIEQKE